MEKIICGLEWKTEGVMDGRSDDNDDEEELEWLKWGKRKGDLTMYDWRNETGSWFQRWSAAKRNKRLVIGRWLCSRNGDSRKITSIAKGLNRDELIFFIRLLIFTARRVDYAVARYLFVCLSVRPSVTRRYLCGLDVTQDHWKWYRSNAWIRFPIHSPL